MENEKRLIDANDVKIREKIMKIVCDGLEDGCVGHCNFPHCYRVNNVTDQLIENDVVLIVRCKDCKSYIKEDENSGICTVDVAPVDNPYIDGAKRMACDFCSYGERR